MTDFEELRGRIDEAKKRLGMIEDGHAQQFETLKGRLVAVKDGLVRTQDEINQQRQELTSVMRENEQLRGMLHKLLLAIEASYGDRLKDILQDIEIQISTLVDLTENAEPAGEEDKGAATATSDPAGTAEVARVSNGKEEPPTTPPAPGEAPDESDSRWLKEIMETARDLTSNMKQAAP